MSDDLVKLLLAAAGPGAIVLGLAGIAALRIVLGGRYSVLRGICWGVVFFGALVVLSAMNVVGGMFLWVVGLIVFGMALYQLRVARQAGLLATLAAAAEKQVPLAEAVEAFAFECEGLYGQNARLLADDLRQGHSLPEALELRPRLLPHGAVLAARVGSETGALGVALRDAAESHQSFQPLRNVLMIRLAYLLFVVLGSQAYAMYISVQVAPHYEDVWADFDAELPLVAQIVFGTSGTVFDYWFLLMPVVLLAELALFGYLTLRYLGWLPGILPARRLDSAAVMRGLAFVARRGLPMTRGLGMLARTYPRYGVRKRLARVQQGVEQGADWCDELRRKRLLSSAQAGVLQSAARLGNLPWALKELAAGAERRYLQRAHALLNVLAPLAVVAVGGLLFVVVAGCFLPLVTIIEGLV